MTTDEDLHTLTGAYLLDSLPEPERLAFEAHLNDCEACRHEVERLHDATTTLAPEPIAPPAGLRDRIVQQARATPQEPPGPTHPARRHASRSPWPLRLTAAAAVVLLVAVGGLSYTLVNVTERLEQSQATAGRFVELLAAPDVTVATAQGVDGANGRVIASTSRDEALVVLDRLEPAPPDGTYQLWLIEGEQATSAGLFDTDAEGRATAALASGLTDVDAVGVTLEPAGGSPQPTTDPVLAIELD